MKVVGADNRSFLLNQSIFLQEKPNPLLFTKVYEQTVEKSDRIISIRKTPNGLAAAGVSRRSEGQMPSILKGLLYPFLTMLY